MHLPQDVEIAVVAPFPTTHRVREGWMSRINAVDAILRPKKRLYINFAPHHAVGRDDHLLQYDESSWELHLCPHEVAHQKLLDEIVATVSDIYVHTVHLAEHISPWLPTGKFIVDFHGIVPEEEIMLGRPECAPKYTEIEQQVLRHARCVMVTSAMQRHYARKYPQLSPSITILPIVEKLQTCDLANDLENGSYPVRVLYAGGTQTWQNVDAMLALAKRSQEFATFTFLSHDWQLIKVRGEASGLPSHTEYRFCAKDDLPVAYANADFGLVLRDDTAVNRVACPTKLYEYLVMGLVPVVRSPELGDFQDLGYVYITEEEFASGFIPDNASRNWMIKANKRAAARLVARFRHGAENLTKLLDVG